MERGTNAPWPILTELRDGVWKTGEGRRQMAGEYAHALLFLGYLVLLVEFTLLEKYVVPRHWISSVLDQYVPFVPVFVIPYVLWFPLVGITLIALCFTDRGDFVRAILLLYAGMGTALTIYAFFPHGQPLRPIITGKDMFSQLVLNSIYANDTNTNCFPSIHVLNQMAVCIGLCSSKLGKRHPGWCAGMIFMTVLVNASTCLIKQHSVLDVGLALALEVPLALLVYRVDWNRLVPASVRAAFRRGQPQEN